MLTAAGSGLTGGASSGEANLAINDTVVQRRLGGGCTSAQAIQAVTQAGTQTCVGILSSVSGSSNINVTQNGTTGRTVSLAPHVVVTSPDAFPAIEGHATSPAAGPAAIGVFGSQTGLGYGMWAQSTGTGSIGIFGKATGTNARAAVFEGALDVVGQSTLRRTGSGPSALAAGFGAGSIGIQGSSDSATGVGVQGLGAAGGLAGRFQGNVAVTGNLSATGTITSNGAKPFTIDHPLDPANQVLRHASIEAPEVLNQYSGNVVTDRRGFATVRLPAYFDALNATRDVRYLLTPVGSFTQAIVARELRDGRFTIRTRRPRTKVSWVLIARRDDRTLRAAPFRAEEAKRPGAQGRYLQPELYGRPLSQRISDVTG